MMAGVLRWITAGESHGPALVAVLEGMVAGVEITTKELTAELARRKLGHGRSPRMAFEADELEVIGGIRHGVTQGGPIAVRIGNTEWPKWETVMAADPVDPELIASRARNAPLTRPRPGHADLAGMTKYGFDDARPVLERASARETASRVVLGTVAKAFLRQALGVEIVSHVVAIGAVDAPDDDPVPGPGDLERVDASPVRAFSEATAAAMMAEIDAAHDDGDTLGGVIEVIAYGLPVGLGSYVHGRPRLDARLAGALMGIQAMKGVEIGDGFRTAHRRGSAAHDEMLPAIRTRRRGRGPAPDRTSPGVARRPSGQEAVEPGRRHRGRDDQRRAGAGAGGDEADLDGAARAAHGRRRDRGGGHRDPPAFGRVRGAAGRASWRRRWWRWCSPTRRWRSSAATPSPRPAATPAPIWRRARLTARRRRSPGRSDRRRREMPVGRCARVLYPGPS